MVWLFESMLDSGDDDDGGGGDDDAFYFVANTGFQHLRQRASPFSLLFVYIFFVRFQFIQHCVSQSATQK